MAVTRTSWRLAARTISRFLERIVERYMTLIFIASNPIAAGGIVVVTIGAWCFVAREWWRSLRR
jgi:hypothetical protein